jgi:hypothetical protein
VGSSQESQSLQVARITFRDARLRVDRAGEHLAELQPQIQAFARRQEGKVVAEIQGTRVVLRRLAEVEDPPRVFSVIIGEVLYNLRAALDYLVYALAWLDSGSRQEQTQFVIADSRASFDSQAASRLKGLSAHHIEAIREWQPFSGQGWIRDLREASNQDKHRALNLAVAAGSGTVEAVRDESGNVVGQRRQETIELEFVNGPPIMVGLLTKGEDYAFERPSLTRRKLRRLELLAGAERRRGGGRPRGAGARDKARREAELELARQAEIAYRRLSGLAAERGGCGRDTGTRIFTPSERQAARQGIGPRPCALARRRPHPTEFSQGAASESNET